eukprot:m51a1_g2076 hypothetical protein (830) ;mRNA; r:1484890-1488386
MAKTSAPLVECVAVVGCTSDSVLAQLESANPRKSASASLGGFFEATAAVPRDPRSIDLNAATLQSFPPSSAIDLSPIWTAPNFGCNWYANTPQFGFPEGFRIAKEGTAPPPYIFYALRTLLDGPTALKDIPDLDVPLYTVIDTLGEENLVMLLRCLLLEQKLLVVSSDLALLTIVCEGLVSLLYPFRGPGVYIPVLPASMSEFVHCLGGPVIGIHDSSLRRLEGIPPNLIKKPTELPYLPPDAEEALLRDLKEVWRPHHGKTQSLDWEPWGANVPTPSKEFDLLVRAAFLKFQCQILRGYQDCVTYLRIFEPTVKYFDSHKFIRMKKTAQTFYKELSMSQMFSVFTEEFGRGDTLFDEALQSECWRKPVSEVADKLLLRRPRVKVLEFPTPKAPAAQEMRLWIPSNASPMPLAQMGEAPETFTWKPHFASSPSFMAATRSPFIDQINEKLKVAAGSVPNIDESEIAQVKKYLMSEELRRMWADGFLSSGIAGVVSAATMSVLVDIVLVLLAEATKDKDYESIYVCLKAVSTIRSPSSSEETTDTLIKRLGSPEVWQNRKFWNHYYTKEASALKAMYGSPAKLSDLMSKWHTLPEAERAAVVAREQQWVFDLLQRVVQTMAAVGTSPKVQQRFIADMATQVVLDSAHREALEESARLAPAPKEVEELPKGVVEASAVVLWVFDVNVQTNSLLDTLRQNAFTHRIVVIDFPSSRSLREWLQRHDVGALQGRLKIVTSNFRATDGAESAANAVVDLREAFSLSAAPVFVLCSSIAATKRLRALPLVSASTSPAEALRFCLEPPQQKPTGSTLWRHLSLLVAEPDKAAAASEW